MKKILPILLFCLIPVFAIAQTLSLDGTTETYESIINYTVTMNGESELHLTGENPIEGATINIVGEDAWLFIHGERPSYLTARLSQITINGSVAVDDVNVRIHQYEMGVVLIPHDDDYAGATLFADANLSGDSLNIKHHTIYTDVDDLGSMNNALSSFVLRKGYMMTIAQQTNGSGYSKNYVADTEDIIVNQIDEALDNEVSFVRVVRWNWATKKGINNVTTGELVQASWFYNWGSKSESSDDMEFVPMKWNGGNVNETNFITKKNITHQLAFNEPSHDEQSNMTVDDALREYPKLLATGLRAGSPNIADNGKPWLYEFMEKADELNYRIDFVGVHWYKGCQTAQQFYTWLKDVYDQTGRPIWITEFNNGADWTAENCIPTYEEQAEKMASFLEMFDTTSFIERYCIYNWGKETRKLAPNNGEDGTLYLSGEVYRDQASPFAYNEDMYYTPIYVEIPAPVDLILSKGDNDAVVLTWYDNAYQEDGFSIERSHEGGAYEEIGTVEGEQTYKVTYTDPSRVDYGEYSYRVRTKKGDDYSAYSDVVTSVLDDGIYNICYIKHNESGMFLGANGYDLEMMDSTQTGTDVQWIVVPAADAGFYYVYNLENSYRLYNSSGSPVLNGDTTWNGNNYQWALEDAGDDYYLLNNRSEGKLLWTKAEALTTITFVETSWSGTKSQWKFIDTGVEYGDETSVTEHKAQTFSVSPTPCESILSIHGLEQEVDVRVLSVSGKVLMQTQTQGNLDVSELDQGIYFLQIENTKVLKFMKK